MPHITDTPSRPPPDAPAEQPRLKQGFAERRRPGRLENPSAYLIPLMRGQTDVQAERPTTEWDAFIHAATQEASDGEPSASKGILYGILLSVPLWIASALFARWLLRF